MYDKKLYQRYAMCAEEMIQESEEFAGSIEIDAIANKLGLPQGQGQQIASYLDRIGWATANFRNEPPILTLTPKGFDEVEKLRWPTWKLWLHYNLTTTLAVLATVLSVLNFVKSFFAK